MKTKSELITDEQTLAGAQTRFGSPIRVYDDGYGQLFIHRDSMGITGIVRTQTWEDAYSICEDEFFPAADEEAWKEAERIDAMEDGKEKNHDQACWDEAYGYRSNSRQEPDGTTSSIYAKDLNGDRLDVLSAEMVAELEITLEITDPEPEPEPEQRYHIWHITRRPTRNGRALVVSWSGRYGTQGSRIRPLHKYQDVNLSCRHSVYAGATETPFNPQAD